MALEMNGGQGMNWEARRTEQFSHFGNYTLTLWVQHRCGPVYQPVIVRH